ncbi:MAG TPA: hypothetical protein VD971_00330 [Phycisphaerales bacterium]|nr:hypothetical protein [Phycisphaerales bacterium]
MTEWWHWAILIGANTPIYLLIGWAMFGTWGDFWQCLKFWIMPDIFSAMRGEWLEDVWSELKLVFFLAACAVIVAAEWWVLTNHVL